MAIVPKFFVCAELCTEYGDGIGALPQAFRRVPGEQVAGVYGVELDVAHLTTLQDTMTNCPGHALLGAP